MLHGSASKGKSLAAFVLLILCLAFLSPVSAFALDESAIDYEVKFLLDSDLALTDDHLLTDDLCALTGAGTEYQVIDAIYLETADRTFSQEGWINRIRWKENKKKIECTSKKRYPLSGQDAETIRAALAQTEADGFIFSDTAYSAEIDWGYSQMTLNAAWESSGTYKDYQSLAQFSTDDAIDFFKSMMPDEEQNWKEDQWGRAMLDQAQMVGPLQYRRFKGNWNGTEIKIDVCLIGDSYTTELSFKASGLEAASALREQMTALLEEKGILLHLDSLKTQTILNSYLRDYPLGPGLYPS